jgi:ribosomal protein S18 acetylase RimI-like enzyme
MHISPRRSRGKFYALYSSEGLPLGLYCLLIEDHPARKGYAEILDLGVVESHRRQGIGSRLLQDAEHKSKAASVFCVYLSTYAGDAGAIAFYRQSGYTRVAELPGLDGADDRGQVILKKIIETKAEGEGLI